MSLELKGILLESFFKSRLAPFYIFNPRSRTNHSKAELLNWVQDFLGNIISKSKNLPLERGIEIVQQGHADILWIKRIDQSKAYSIKEGHLDELFKFMNFGALELSWRFAVIEDPHKLSPAYLNKLLKTLEEPAAKTSVIFLNHTDAKFLDTIHSRANEFSLSTLEKLEKWSPPQKISSAQEWLEKRKQHFPVLLENPALFKLIANYFDGNDGLSELIERLKTVPDSDQQMAGLIVEYEADRPGRVKQKNRLCSELKWFQESKIYNNSAWERLLGLLMVVDS